MLRPLSKNPGSPSEPLVESGPLFLDRFDQLLEHPPPGGCLPERRVGDLGEDQLFHARARVVEPRARLPELSLPPSVGPMEPPEATRLPVEHHRQRTESRPLPAGRDQPLLHPMGKDVSNPAKEGLLVQDWLRRVAPFPE